jgi:hypothetical protein
VSATTTLKTIPVVCECGSEEMTFEVTTEGDHRVTVWACPNCHFSEVNTQERHHLWANQNTVYIGSYWG